MSCSFCQWGALETPNRTASCASLSADLRALSEHGVANAQLVDAGLNLNQRAFAALRDAEAQVGYFRNARMFASIYPHHLRTEHLDFLASLKRPKLDIGIQSFDPGALSAVDRPFSEDRFARLVQQLDGVADLEIELIMGLPGDSLEKFDRSVRRAMQLPATLRVFYCLVLPDALLDRGPSEPELDFDPLTLRLRAGPGWSAEDIQAARHGLESLVAKNNGERSADTWQLPHPELRNKDDMRLDPAANGAGLTELELAQLRTQIVSRGGWSLTAAQRSGTRLLVGVRHPAGEAVLCVSEPGDEQRVYDQIAGYDVRYKVVTGASPTADAEAFDGLLADLIGVACAPSGASDSEN